MRRDGFPELHLLWSEFRRRGREFETADLASAESRSAAHVDGLRSHPVLAVLVCLLLALLLCGLLRSMLEASAVRADPWPSILTSLFVETPGVTLFFVLCGGFLFFAAAVALMRMWVHPWKACAAQDLASMLKPRDCRRRILGTERASGVRARLSALGVGEAWDDPGYRVLYRFEGERLETVPVRAEHEFVQTVLREVLGTKEDRRFRPGRFLDSLTGGKKTVTEFIDAHRDEIERNRQGLLPRADALALLAELRSRGLVPGSPGERFVAEAAAALERGDQLTGGTVEARVWARDPWVDLTSPRDFFSSASLRGFGLRDGRSKGRLGPFGYLRNASITALDFRTRHGRSVRARMAAAIMADADGGERPVLFVDGVEGRFDVNPRHIKQAIEDYGRACAFPAVLYFKYPLNRVPGRFVQHVERSGAPLAAVRIAYADSSRREYLDAFGMPFEPFEYAYPRGRVVVHAVDLAGTPGLAWPRPGPLSRAAALLRHRSLHLLALGASVAGGWSIWRFEPLLLLPYAMLLGGLLLVDERMHRQALKPGPASPAPEAGVPPFVRELTDRILADPLARKMSYEARLEPKVARLLRCFPRARAPLRHFFAAVLVNVSVRDSDLLNAMKFLDAVPESDRESAARLFAKMWDREDPGAERAGLSEEKAARDGLKKDLLARLDLLRRACKAIGLRSRTVKAVLSMRRWTGLPFPDVLRIVTVDPGILRGLRKPPRPRHAWVGPTAIALAAWYGLTVRFPGLPLWLGYVVTMVLVAVGLHVVCTYLPIAPGILRYRRTIRYLSRVLAGERPAGAIEERMREAGIDVAQYTRARVREDSARGVRIRILDKRTLEGAVRFLTSSEDIGSCIALRHFVSWTLPSLLDDPGIVLADVYHKGTHPTYVHRAQVWMVAAEEEGVPVLAVNSFEFNEAGTRYLDDIMSEAVALLREVAREAGFRKIYAGISEFGRGYLDARFPQGPTGAAVRKIHDREAGRAYYFDAFHRRLCRTAEGLRSEFVYMKRRGVFARTYALVYGVQEFLKGHRGKARAFFDTVRNPHNFWEIPLAGPDGSVPAASPSSAGGADGPVLPREDPGKQAE